LMGQLYPICHPATNIIRVKLTVRRTSVIGGPLAGRSRWFGSRCPMDKARRKAAIAEYKEREAAIGIFAVRCGASGEVWVGSTLNLDTVQNRIWFGLRLGSHPNADMQRAWTRHGGESFSYEVLERLDPDEPAFVRDDQMKDRLAHWLTTL